MSWNRPSGPVLASALTPPAARVMVAPAMGAPAALCRIPCQTGVLAGCCCARKAGHRTNQTAKPTIQSAFTRWRTLKDRRTHPSLDVDFTCFPNLYPENVCSAPMVPSNKNGFPLHYIGLPFAKRFWQLFSGFQADLARASTLFPVHERNPSRNRHDRGNLYPARARRHRHRAAERPGGNLHRRTTGAIAPASRTCAGSVGGCVGRCQSGGRGNADR